jgi:hypothetical protein
MLWIDVKIYAVGYLAGGEATLICYCIVQQAVLGVLAKQGGN